MIGDSALGYHVLTVFSSVKGVSRSAVIANYKSRYGGEVAIDNLGRAAQGISMSKLSDEIAKLPKSESPSRVDLMGAVMKSGGKSVSIAQAVVEGVKETAKDVGSAAFSTLKWVTVLAVVAVGAYVLVQTGVLRRARG